MSEHSPRPSRLTRRQAIRRGAGGLLTVSSFPALLAACGDSSDSAGSTAASTAAKTTAGPTPAAEVKGDLVLAGYPDWYGPNEFKDFAAKYPGATVKNVTDGDGTAAQIAQLSKNKGDYDLTLAGINASEQFKLAGTAGAVRPRPRPEPQGRRPGVHQGVPVRHPDGLRQDRLRLPQGPHLRAADDVEGAVGLSRRSTRARRR